ncbi:DNA polymerase III subunit alpha [Metamycoplasma hyosynoviae]|uniref:DNA polymerase III subunit alpha n=1 Tax=Metamycoplasma hyosynoviae TaxID=29559 RepID=UPI0023659334|nr:DNA polymerase III subunit alpha [Metamycoplasma hyosynoviae]MDD7894308.1 DNA polymerase III subunit alpha [Metamycoplasma hyosynoviae]
MKLINGHLNTIFSFMESAIQPDEFLKLLKNSENKYFAVTEHNNFFSYAFFLKKAKELSLKPIFGIDLDLEYEDTSYRFILYPKNKNGLIELFLLSKRKLSGEIILLDEVLQMGGVYIIDHPLYGLYSIQKQEIIHNDYYFSFSYENIASNEEFIFKKLNKCLLINYNIILDTWDNSIINVLKNIENKQVQETKNFYEILQLDIDCQNNLEKQLISLTNTFLEKCYIEGIENIPDQFEIPHFENGENLDSINYLKTILIKGIKNKFNKETWTTEYQKRLSYEIEIVEKLKFADYFLIVQDFVNFAKQNQIGIGPGRGSAAGSLICYLLNITEIDPLKYGLIFERFLNPNRKNMPDIDIDIQDNRRSEVIEYIINKYGEDKVATIVTFSTLGKKSAIRDVLRSHNILPLDINEISKSIASDSEKTLLEEFEHNETLKNKLIQLNRNDHNFASEIIEEANKIDGFYRQTGTHAAGIVIGNKNLNEIIPTYIVEKKYNQSQISMEYLEDFGLLKIDLLGLKTLATIREIVEKINITHPDFSLDKINYNDKKTFELLSQGNTLGVFQLESYGMIKAIKKIQVNSFNDIVATISLFRPGPMDNISEYASRKSGKKEIVKVNDTYDQILKSTYGIIIYQEQIMQIFQLVANKSFAEADQIRRIISKKQHTEVAKLKDDFIECATKNNYSKKIATQIYENIEKFADYGFNKSHAVSYATVAYQMAYLKANYPLEFYASIISSAHGAHETISKYVAEASNMGIKVNSPEINISDENVVIYNNQIYLPLTQIKGLGPETIKAITKNRAEIGSYKNFEHFVFSIFTINGVGASTIELLIKASALRNFGHNQETLLYELYQGNPDVRSDLLIKVQSFKNEMQRYFDQKLWEGYEPAEIKKIDVRKESENETNLLGGIYNFHLTKKYEVEGQRLIDLHFNNEYIIYFFCNRAVQRNGNYGIYYWIDIQDSSQKINFNVYNNKSDLRPMQGKIIKAKLIKKINGYILRDWKIIEDNE